MPTFTSRFREIPRRVPIDEHNIAVQFDESKCKNCTLCRRKCANEMTVLDHYYLPSTGDMPMCVHCGQCAAVCPFGAITEVSEIEKVKAAIKNPELLTEASKVVGSQAVVVGIDAKRRYVDNPSDAPDKNVVETDEGYCWFDCSIYGGREFTGMDAIEWAVKCQELGAGEILLTSMDGDGTKEGYDIALNKAINDAIDIPVIASGGGGNPAHILDVFQKTDVSAALAASIFHFTELTPKTIRNYLASKGISVRKTN